MNNLKKRAIVLFLIGTILPGCSVYKAASNSGISVEDIQMCKTQECFLSHGMEEISHNESNHKCIKTYRAQAKKSSSSYWRAAAHGVADVMTVGLWEVAGTPIESSISDEKKYILAKITYTDMTCIEPESIKIYDEKGFVLTK